MRSVIRNAAAIAKAMILTIRKTFQPPEIENDRDGAGLWAAGRFKSAFAAPGCGPYAVAFSASASGTGVRGALSGLLRRKICSYLERDSHEKPTATEEQTIALTSNSRKCPR
jgi:hypothetical protein